MPALIMTTAREIKVIDNSTNTLVFVLFDGETLRTAQAIKLAAYCNHLMFTKNMMAETQYSAIYGEQAYTYCKKTIVDSVVNPEHNRAIVENAFMF